MRAWLVVLLNLMVAACGDDAPACDPASNFGCDPALQCEVVAGRSTATCLPPVVVRGKVSDASSGIAVASARVLAIAPDGAPLAPAASAIFDGSYEIRLHAPREASFAPRSLKLSILVSAPGYGISPHPWRDAAIVDIAAAQATPLKDKLVLATPDTDAALIAFTGGPGRGAISGHVDRPASGGAVLVVAESAADFGRPRGTGGWADSEGNYTIYALPPAELRVRAYVPGVVYGERLIGLNVGEQTTADVHLDASLSVATVTGRADVAGGGTPEVELVIESTYDPRTSAGESVGLRTHVRGDGGFTFTGVPPGSYLVVSRAVDGLVAVGTRPRVVVAGADVAVADRLRLVAAMTVLSPGADGPQGVSGAPTLSWMDDDAEESYRVQVINLAGLEVYARSERKHTGDAPALPFEGSLVRGMVYRLTVDALDGAGQVITRTEDLRGVFFPLE